MGATTERNVQGAQSLPHVPRSWAGAECGRSGATMRRKQEFGASLEFQMAMDRARRRIRPGARAQGVRRGDSGPARHAKAPCLARFVGLEASRAGTADDSTV